MRKGFFELIVGVLCVALVSGAAWATHNRGRLRAHWLRLRFLTSEEDAEANYCQLVHCAPDLARGLACEPEELEIYLDPWDVVRVRNNRGQRVYAYSGEWGGRILSPGEGATLEEVLAGDAIGDVPTGGAGVVTMGVGGGSVSGCFGYASGKGRRREVRPPFGVTGGK